MNNLEYLNVKTHLESQNTNTGSNKLLGMLGLLFDLVIGLATIILHNQGYIDTALLMVVVILFIMGCSIIVLIGSISKEGETEKKLNLLDKLYFEKIEVEEAIKQLGLLPEPEASETK